MAGTPRVLHLYRKFSPDYTGDGLYYRRLIPYLRTLQTEHLVLATETAAPQAEARVDDIEVHYLAGGPWASQPFALHRWLWAHRGKFDVLHIHSHVDWRLSAYVMTRLLGKAVLFSCSLDDSPGELLRRYGRPYRRVAAALMHAIQVFVAISPRLYHLSVSSVARERVRQIPQGVLPPSATPGWEVARAEIRASLGLAPEAVLLLNVGSICARKNTAFMVEALAALRDPRVHLVVVGPVLEPEYAAEVDALASRLGVSSRVHKIGFCERPEVYYKAADVLVFASHAEGLSNVYLEAMSHRLPVLTLYLPSLVDHLFDFGRTGFFARDLAGFSKLLRTLVDDPALRQRVGLAAQAHVQAHYGMAVVARQYADLYAELIGRALPAASVRSTGEPEPAASPAVALPQPTFCSNVADGPAALGFRRARAIASKRPVLMIVVDTESEFEWSAGTQSDQGEVTSIRALLPFVSKLCDIGAPPCLVADYPVATGAESSAVIRELAGRGAEIGVHLQPWSTPPLGEPLDAWHSYGGNLAPQLERAKLRVLKDALETLVQQPVRSFKAGRYGAGPSTFATLRELGFDIDLSVCPGYDFSRDGGPDWRRYGTGPAWIGGVGGLLELPTTAGRTGLLAGLDLTRGTASSAERWLSRLRLSELRRLSPEGNSLQELVALARRLRGQGLDVFTLSFHSPSLMPGFTHYTRSAEDVERFKNTILAFIEHFRGTLGGEVLRPAEVRQRLKESA